MTLFDIPKERLSELSKLKARRVSLVALSGMTFDLETPQGRMMATRLAGVAEFERDLTQERISRRGRAFRKELREAPCRPSLAQCHPGAAAEPSISP